MITIFKKGALIGDFRDDKDAVAVVFCDDIYVSKFLNCMTKEKLKLIEKKSKRWVYPTYFDWL